MMLLLLLAGCSGGTQPDASHSDGFSPGSVEWTLLRGLPPLPAGRATSKTQEIELLGWETYDRSANAIPDVDSLKLNSADDALSWGIWHFNPPLKFIAGIEIVMDVPPKEKAWVAVSDFERGTWDLDGPLTAGKTIVPDEARHRSASGDLYVAVISCDGNIPVVHKLIMTTEDGWTIVTVDDAELAGSSCCLAVIGDHPAISYYDEQGGNLKYAFAGTVTGSDSADWETTFVDSGTADVGRHTSLALVENQPAISYYDETNGALRYARRNPTLPPSPPTWTRIIVDTNDAGTNVGSHSSLAVVDGRPLICYYDYTSDDLRHAVSLTTTGTAEEDWVTYLTDGEGITGRSCSLAEVDGSAAVSYYSETAQCLKYKWFGEAAVISICAVGEEWDPGTSLAVVAGNPAIAFYSDDAPGLLYARSDTPRGSALEDWSVKSIDSRPQAGYDASLAVVDGRPAIAYRLSDYYGPGTNVLMFAWSEGPTGALFEDWQVLEVDGDASTSTGYSASLTEVDGKPAICYYDALAGHLMYAIRLGP